MFSLAILTQEMLAEVKKNLQEETDTLQYCIGSQLK